MVKRNFGGRQVQLVVSYRRLDELADILDKFSYRVLKEDCLDLPRKSIYKTISRTDTRTRQSIQTNETNGTCNVR